LEWTSVLSFYALSHKNSLSAQMPLIRRKFAEVNGGEFFEFLTLFLL
jgi:hypothetical protein